MNLRNALTVVGLAAVIAIPATGSAQYYYPVPYYGPSYSVPYPVYVYGPFNSSSYVPGPSFTYSGGSGYRIGGARVYFGGGGYNNYRSYGSARRYRGYRPGNHLYRPHR